MLIELGVYGVAMSYAVLCRQVVALCVLVFALRARWEADGEVQTYRLRPFSAQSRGTP